MKKHKALSKETTDILNKYAEEWTKTRELRYKRLWYKKLESYYNEIQMGV